jgi:hypothetical protein
VTTAAKLPAPPAEVPVCRDVTGLAPKFRAAVGRVLFAMHQRGFSPKIAETLRTDARQRYLFGFGRTYDDDRGVVTHSHNADETWHAFGLAADIVCAVNAWDAPAAFWSALMECAEAEGLTSGSDWDRDPATKEHFVDEPHVQWGPPMRRSPSPRAARLMAIGGYEAVWKEVAAL